MTSCALTDRSRIPGPVMARFDTGDMDQAAVAKYAMAYAKSITSDEPVLISWFNKKDGLCGPENICHENGAFWLDYAIGHGADFSVVVNDWDYVFVFKKN